MADVPKRRSYVFFASRFAHDTYCAVPTCDPIPEFLFDGGWRFVGVFHGRKPRPYYFREKRAQAAVLRDGYYIFTAPCARDRPARKLDTGDNLPGDEVDGDLLQGTSIDGFRKP